MHTIQKSSNSYHVIAGEVIDNTNSSLKNVTNLLWSGVRADGEMRRFKTKDEAVQFVKGGL